MYNKPVCVCVCLVLDVPRLLGKLKYIGGEFIAKRTYPAKVIGQVKRRGSITYIGNVKLRHTSPFAIC